VRKLKADQRKAEHGARIIRHFRVGYILILFTPPLSFAVLGLLVGIIESLDGEGEMLTAWNILIMVLWIIGISLYTYGYVRGEATGAEARMILLFGFFFIPWGLFTYLFASGLRIATIFRSMNPGMSGLTIWDYLEFWVWELKGILWIGTGLLLIVTSLVEVQAARFCRKRLKKLQSLAIFPHKVA
jgi:hypothetical protein